MAAYVKLTNFAVKDGLLSGNPLKVVTGAELDDEFNAIAASSSLNYTALESAAANISLKYAFSTTVTMADPGSGILRFNNAAAASTTAIAIDDNNSDSQDISAYINSWDDGSSTNKGTLFLRQSSTVFAIFTITGLTDNSGWSQLAVTYVSGSGTFVDGTTTYVQFNRVGDASAEVLAVAGIAADVTTVAGIAANVTTVAGISANVTTVAGNTANINTVAGNTADIATVAGISSDVTAVAGVAASVPTVAGVATDIPTVAANSANITSVAAIDSDVTAVAGIASDVSAVAAQFIGWNFSTTTSMADPGSGAMRFNNATLASVTAIALDDLNSAAADVSAYVLTWDDATSAVKGTLTVRQGTNNYVIFNVTGLTDNVGWTELAVTHVSSSGTFLNNTLTFVDFDRTGDAGTGDVVGPASSTGDNIALFNGTTGKLLKDGGKGVPSGAIVGTTDTQTLSGKTLTSVKETRTAPSISGNALTLDLSTANVFDVSLNANITTLTISNPAASGTAHGFVLTFTADGTARTVTWGAAVKWPGGTAPTLTSTNGKKDAFVFMTTDGGTSWHAFVAGQNL